ncbi:MAG TPA: transcription termination factor Rho [Opitutaceae bacterium]
MEDSDTSGADASKSGAKARKPAAKRAVTTRTKTTKKTTSRAKAAAAAAPAPELAFEAPPPPPAPPPRAPEPEPVREAAPPPPPAVSEQREVFTPRGRDDSAGSETPAADAQGGHADASSGGQDGAASSGGSDDNRGGQGNGHGQGGGQGQGGNGGPASSDRDPWWKRKKDKKRQKWMDKQQNRGGGGGGGHSHHNEPRHPPQPPPPTLAPVRHGDLPDPARFQDVAALDALAATFTGEPLYLDELYGSTLAELNVRARQANVKIEGVPNRLQLLEAIFKHADAEKRLIIDRGWIDLTDHGHGFIVHEHVNYRLYPEDAYLPESLVNRYGLKRGHQVEVVVVAPKDGDRCPAVIGVRSVMGGAPEDISKVTPFEELVPYYPLKRILLEATEIHKDISMRSVDLLTPVGFGQRGLIVAPPRTGKTVLLQNIANSISHNFPEVKLILLLIDERPEEVTDFKRHTKGEVVSSTFDEAPESHVHAAEMVCEKARRMVEQGQHVVILLDSITRLARAYNALASNSGKIMSGGVEATALQKPKRFFGSARNIEGGGSITILGTALIDTGSRMDEVIFEEFKGTGNMELHLDRGLSDKRIFPAINIDRSGTRKEELIYHPEEMLRVYGLRRAMQGIPPVEAMEMFIQRLKKTKSNAEFLMSLNR